MRTKYPFLVLEFFERNSLKAPENESEAELKTSLGRKAVRNSLAIAKKKINEKNEKKQN